MILMRIYFILALNVFSCFLPQFTVLKPATKTSLTLNFARINLHSAYFYPVLWRLLVYVPSA